MNYQNFPYSHTQHCTFKHSLTNLCIICYDNDTWIPRPPAQEKTVTHDSEYFLAHLKNSKKSSKYVKIAVLKDQKEN